MERQLRASCNFALGRAQVSLALASPPGAMRDELLRRALADLSRARQYEPRRAEIPYLAGLAELSLRNPQSAASEFAAAYKLGGSLESKSLQQLQRIYDASPAQHTLSFDAYFQGVPLPTVPPLPPAPGPSTQALPGYAGSTACRQCHTDVYDNWSHTGMAKMFRPYRPENVIGDFTHDNQYYNEDGPAGQDRGVPAPEAPRKLFARMIVDSGRHYFEIRQSDGWHRYPIDYTIGSKWEQAYATRLPNGEIHVFPIQYNLVQKRWVNFWKTLDAPGSPRTDLAQWQNLDIYTSYQANCATCHTSQLRNINGGDLAPNGLEFLEPGINCEMCHGPSARHVAAMSGGKPYRKLAIDPPVDFRRISAAEFVAICAQCHEQSAVRHAGTHGELNYSPVGQFYQQYHQRPLGEFIHKAVYKDGRFRGTAFIIESMVRSECFKKGNVTCGNCHDPHAADSAVNPTSLKFRDRPDQMCLQCHAQFRARDAMEGHTHHAMASEGSRCVSCHMPRIMDALMFEARSHEIDEIPDADMTQRFGLEESPNACLQCHKNQSAELGEGATRLVESRHDGLPRRAMTAVQRNNLGMITRLEKAVRDLKEIDRQKITAQKRRRTNSGFSNRRGDIP